MSRARFTVTLGLLISSASVAKAEQFPEATAFARDFMAICLAGPDDETVARKAAEHRMNVSVVGRKTGRTMPVAKSGRADDQTVMLNAMNGVWSCLMIRSDPKYAIPLYAVRNEIDRWPDGVTTEWTVQRSASPIDEWFTYGKIRGHDFYVRTNRLHGDAVLYFLIEQE